jgi:hypothetical protein
MKYLQHILLFIFFYSTTTTERLYAQQPLNQINIISFNVKNKLPADVNSWDNNPTNIMLVAQKMPQVLLQGVKLVLQIKQGNSKICGNTIQSASIIDGFAVRNFSANELVGLLTPCQKLAINNYTVCAQFFNVDNYPISKEFCKDFMVGDVFVNYTAPQNISPLNEKTFTENSIKVPITFRWIPITPKPLGSVTYRLRIWQLMQGQTGVQATKANEPIIEKQITNINFVIVPSLFISPCKPPYLCNFIWNVQALDRDGKPIGKGNGTSELFSFNIK